MNTRYFILLFCFCCVTKAFCQNVEFIENKGQWDARVKYMGNVNNGAFFIHDNGFTVVQHDANDLKRLHDSHHPKKNETPSFIAVHSHAYRMEFINTKGAAKIIADKPILTYNNYFIGNDPTKWASNCKIYQGITLKDVYPNVDVRYYTDKGFLKYDLIVNPGANIDDIALRYEGANDLEIKNKELVINTSVGKLRELAPYSYQYNEKGKEEISVKYVLKNNVVRFDVKNYDRNTTLVIDPTLIFCSFTGSASDNWGFTATYGPDGSMFGGGIVYGNSFPVSPGAYQNTFGGGSNCANEYYAGFDMGIIKLSPDGTSRVYATYIGGNGNDIPQSLITDAQGDLIVAGKTNSSNYPGTRIGNGGLFDIVITKLNASGSALIGSVIVGGKSDDGVNINACGVQANSLQQNYGDAARSEVNIDAAGNIYLAAATQSNDFPVPGGFQNINKGGNNNQDAVVLKFSPNLSTLLFSTYLGGTGNDAAYVVTVNPFNNNIYIAGGTESTDLPGSTAGTVGPSNHGLLPTDSKIDGFISIISNDGSTIIKTTYLGTSAIDQIYGLQFDLNGFVYVMGQTRGSWPILNAPWSQPNGKQFICKLQPDLSAFMYSTVFGKGAPTPDISPVAFLVDRCENVYISGWGGDLGSYNSAGTKGLTVTADAFKSTTDDLPLGDFYFFVLKKDATTQLFGSFFGEVGGEFADHVDGGTSRFDKNGIIYEAICADCGQPSGSNFPTTPGVWSPTKPPSAFCNLALLKINLDLSGVHGKLQSTINGVVGDSIGCLPIRILFSDIDPQRTATKYEWNFGDGSPQVTTTTDTASHFYGVAGTYKVMMVAIDSSKCFPRDTSYKLIRVSDLRAQLGFQKTKLLPCTAYQYEFINQSVAPPARPFQTSFVWDFGDGSPKVPADTSRQFHSYTSPGTYVVTLSLNDTAYCNNPIQISDTLRVASTVKASFTTPATGCAPYDAQFTNTSQGGSQFNWDFGDGTSSNAGSPTHTYTNPGTYTIQLTAIDSATCNIIDSFKMTITVYSQPTANFTTSPQPPALNTPTSFTNNSSPDAVRFKWEFGDGDSLITTSRNVVQHEYNATGTFNACLTAYNQVGCANKVCQQIVTLIQPAVDVPNAFTPQSGDVNSVVYVRGYGIAKMKFTVWARWGEKVFETEDRKVGWDGKFNGKLLPMDVYAYTLDVQFSDGTSVRKKGDITLIR